MVDSGPRVEEKKEGRKKEEIPQSPAKEDSIRRPFSPPKSSTLAVSLAVLVVAALFRTGWTNVLLVLLCSILLLLNPWVRTFLELAPLSESAFNGRSTYSTYDPARFLQSFYPSEAVDDEVKEEESTSVQDTQAKVMKHMNRSESYAALRRMPAHLRTPIADLEELIIRDYVSTWYEYHSFGEQSLPNQARYSIDHAVGSIYAALENVRNVDVTSELLLTTTSVLLTTLRARRLYPGRKPIFSSDTARITALREALDRVFNRHLKVQDAECELLRILLREILCKQIWNAIGGIGEPDFINRKIVEWGEKQKAKGESEQSGGTESQTSYQQRASTMPVANPALQVDTPSPAAIQPVDLVPPSPTSNRAQASPTMDSHHFSMKPPASPSKPAHARLPPLSSEPLTTQPRAMAMPSPSPLGRSMNIVSVPPSPKLSAPPLPRRPLSVGRGNIDHAGTTDSGFENGSGSSQPPTLPPRKSNPANVSIPQEDNVWAVMPSNIPPDAHKGMVLPDSLQRSMTSNAETNSDDTEGYRLSVDSGHRSTDSGRPNHLKIDPDNYEYSPAKNGGRNTTSVDSHLYATRARPASRPASSASGGIPPAPDLGEVLSGGGSGGLSALRDAFEAFLERGGVASRSLFFSPPSAATVSPGEGEALLKLHVALATIARLVPSEQSDDGEIYREDAYSVILKALQSLIQVDDSIAGRPLREALSVAAQRLDDLDDGHVREVTRPVELALWNRLQGLYEHFWKETCTRPAGSRPTVTSPTLSNSGRSSFSASRQSEDSARPTIDQLNYQPRKKNTINVPSQASSSTFDSFTANLTPRSESTPPNRLATGEEMAALQPVNLTASSSIAPSMMSPPHPVAPLKDNVNRPVPRRAEVQPPSDDEDDIDENEGGKRHHSPLTSTTSLSLGSTPEADNLPSIEIAVTDVSPNAERPAMSVDVRTYEVMIAVEGLVSGGGGFVLLRQWKDFQQLEEQLKKTSSLPDLFARLPTVKGQTSLTLTREVEDYLIKLLSSPTHVGTEAVQYFIDKTRAGEASTNKASLLMDSLRMSSRGGLGLGKTLANGVGGLSKNAFNTLQMMPSNVTGLRTSSLSRRGSSSGVGSSPEKVVSRPLPEDRLDYGIQGAPRDEVPTKQLPAMDAREVLARRERKASLPSSSTTVPPPPPPPPPPISSPLPPQESDSVLSELSPQELDNLLSSFFAIADEAFNLSGGWTLRRGLLRVLEQVVRTQYWSSIMGIFHNLSHSLNQEQIGTWLDQLKDKFWPDEKKGVIPSHQTKSTSDGVDVGDNPIGNHDAAHLVEAVEETKERSLEEKQACHLKAKSIVVAQTPTGSGFFLGPGGKQSCEKALNLLHEEICSPETSLDLVLTIALKLCDIVAR